MRTSARAFRGLRLLAASACVLLVLAGGALASDGHLGHVCEETEDCDRRFVCVKGQCDYCHETSQCVAHKLSPEHYTCRYQSSYDNNICQHKRLFDNFDLADQLGTVMGMVGAAVAAGAGTGGGGLFVPMFILVVGFSAKEAIPLSKAMIFGSAISNLIYNWNKRHPLDSNRRIIDFDIALMMEPMTLGGTVVGVFLNVFLPPWVIVVSLTTLLSLTSVRMLRKGLAKHREESQRAPTSLLGDEMEEATQLLGDGSGLGDGRGDGRGGGGGLLGDEGESVPEPSARNVWDDGRTTFGAGRGVIIKAVHEEFDDGVQKGGDGHADAGDGGENGLGKDGELGGKHGDDDGSGPLLLDDDGPSESAGLRRIREEERSVPTRKLVVLCIAWVGILFLSLLKGGHGAPSLVHIKGCSAAYWGVVAMTFPFLIIITVVVARWLRRQHRRKLELNYPYQHGDVRWTKRNTILYPAMCMIAGILAGLLGIGGGMVKGPLMLEMGVLPQTTAATASFMILFTSSCTTLQFLIMGMLPSDFAIWYAFVGFVSSYVGQVIMGHFVSKYGRVSYIILSIAVVIAGSTLLMGITGTQEVVADIRSGKHLGFSPIC